MKKLLVLLMLGCLVSCTPNLEQKKERTLTNIYENTIYSGVVNDSGYIWFIQVDDINFVKEQLQEWKIPCQDITLIFEKKDYYPYKTGKLYEYSDSTYLYYSVNL